MTKLPEIVNLSFLALRMLIEILVMDFVLLNLHVLEYELVVDLAFLINNFHLPDLSY